MIVKGSPIKGQVKKKNTSPVKKVYLFFLGHSAYISTASFSPLLHTRYFFSHWLWSNTDPHQSPIGIKAYCA